METVLNFLIPLIQTAAIKYPAITSAIAVIGVLRLIFKPIMSVLHAYTEATESKSDDERLVVFEKSKAFKAIIWLVDFFASYKIKK